MEEKPLSEVVLFSESAIGEALEILALFDPVLSYGTRFSERDAGVGVFDCRARAIVI